MNESREKKLAIAILKEKVEKATGKKVIFEAMGKTQLMTDPEVNAKVIKAIALLKSIDIDGETMEFITKQLGMDDQMLSQLSPNQDYSDKINKSLGKKGARVINNPEVGGEAWMSQ